MAITKSERVADEYLLSASELIPKTERLLSERPEIKEHNRVCWLLGISESTLRRYCNSNSLPIGYRRLLLTVLIGVPLTWSGAWAGHRFCAKSGALVDDAGQEWTPGDLRAYRWVREELEDLRRRVKGPAQLAWTDAAQAFSRWQGRQAAAPAAGESAVYSAVREALRDELRAGRLLYS